MTESAQIPVRLSAETGKDITTSSGSPDRGLNSSFFFYNEFLFQTPCATERVFY